jgi:hypothetical protein
MEFLLSHWHCILPVLAMLAAMLLLRDKPQDKTKPPKQHE